MRNVATSHYVSDSMAVPQCIETIKEKLTKCDTKEWKFLSCCIKKRKPVCLFYSGMSGIVSANALACILHAENIPYALFYVRKPHEKSHGQKIEYFYFIPKTGVSSSVMHLHRIKSSLFFCDDLVDTGATKRYTVAALRKAYVNFRNRVVYTLQTSRE